jgi:hypothetical protein
MNAGFSTTRGSYQAEFPDTFFYDGFAMKIACLATTRFTASSATPEREGMVRLMWKDYAEKQ